jgi:hypothetical protein
MSDNLSCVYWQQRVLPCSAVVCIAAAAHACARLAYSVPLMRNQSCQHCSNNLEATKERGRVICCLLAGRNNMVEVALALRHGKCAAAREQERKGA